MKEKTNANKENLIDKSLLEYGILDVSVNNGDTIAYRTDWLTTAYIAIDGTTEYGMYGYTSTRMRYMVMDENKNRMKFSSDREFNPSNLAGGSFIRFTFIATDKDTIVFKHL